MDTLQLYGFFPGDRSGRVLWMLHELGIGFTYTRLSFRDRDADDPAFRAISPLGRVPALRVGERGLCETGVILDWLARHHGSGTLHPDAHDEFSYRSWLALASSSLDHVCFEFVRPDVPEALRADRRAQASRDLRRAFWGPLNGALADRDSVLPGGFCAVDIQVAASLHYASLGGQLDDQPRLAAWLDTMRSRPAAVEAGLFG